MCKGQLSQIDCRQLLCTSNVWKGACSNVFPAITLRDNSTYVCWSMDLNKRG